MTSDAFIPKDSDCGRIGTSVWLIGLLTGLWISLVPWKAWSQNFTGSRAPLSGTYVTGGIDGAIVSFAGRPESPASTRWLPRFSLLFNVGSTLNKDWGPRSGMFTGLSLKNIGLIRRTDTGRVKDRVYALGIPLGLKFGNLQRQRFFIVGAEADLALNFKEKEFRDHQSKTKLNEWFSRRSPLGMPSLFVGMQLQHIDVKFQYYLNSFFRPAFSQTLSGRVQQPYQNLSANLLYLTAGFSFQQHMRLFHSR